MKTKPKYTLTQFLVLLNKAAKREKFKLDYVGRIRSTEAQKYQLTACPLQVVFPKLGWDNVAGAGMLSQKNVHKVIGAADSTEHNFIHRVEYAACRTKLLKAVGLQESK